MQGGPAILQEMPLGKDSLVGITIEGLFVRNRQGRVLSYIPSLHPCNALCVDGRGDVWIGQEDGLVLWNPSTGRRRTFYTTDGLVNNAVQSIIETSDSTLWVSTANGLSCLTVRPADDGLGVMYLLTLIKTMGLSETSFVRVRFSGLPMVRCIGVALMDSM